MGTYEVICYFSANIVDEEDRSEPLEVNLIANGQKQNSAVADSCGK